MSETRNTVLVGQVEGQNRTQKTLQITLALVLEGERKDKVDRKQQVGRKVGKSHRDQGSRGEWLHAISNFHCI